MILTDPERIIAMLDLRPHPEVGWYRQTWAADAEAGDRPAGTCIYLLLQRDERSHWHRVDAAEIWHFYAGAPLVLSVSASADGPAAVRLLGPDLFNSQSPQSVVPPGWWQAAHSLGDCTLVGCTVSLGFRFEGFELAEPGIDIRRSP